MQEPGFREPLEDHRHAPGHWHGRDVTILDIFEAIGAHNAGDMSDEELKELEGVASPGAGACG
ncbi:MAG TPA: hypothetical protein VGV34_05250, partial [Solirubrobacterales bacterium]|nr:hypothetical protein [Solirubrobacterales bacterium]